MKYFLQACRRSVVSASAGLTLALTALGAQSQDLAQAEQVRLDEMQFDEIQRSIGTFSGILREALGLSNSAGIFNPMGSSVRGLWLAEQGVLMEIVSPLAGSQVSLRFQGLDVPVPLPPGFAGIDAQARTIRIQRPDIDGMRRTMEFSLQAAAEVGEQYREWVSQLYATDFADEVESALNSAARQASALHRSGHVDDAQFETLAAEVEQARRSLDDSIRQLRTLRDSVQTRLRSEDPVDDAVAAQWQAALAELQQEVEPLRQAALARVTALQERSEQARVEREQQWQADMAAFEVTLFSAVCDYSAALRALPGDAHVTLVLKGLGEESDERREDRIHVLQKGDIQSCLIGDITAAQLQERARSYSF